MPSILEPAFQINQWQQAFVDRYVTAHPGLGVLVAPPGMGKTTISLHIAGKLLDECSIDAIVHVSTSKELKDYWSSRIERIGIPPEAVETIDAVSRDQMQRLLHRIDPERRCLVMTDDVELTSSIVSQVHKYLTASPQSRALLLTRPPFNYVFDTDLDFNEYYLDERVTRLPIVQSRLVKASPSFRLLNELLIGTTAIDDLSWREFERLIGQLLERDGYRVQLMQGTKDGGVDVIGHKDLGMAGTLKTLWQAKKNSIKNRVGIATVRELADTRIEHGASKAIIVTTSFLTRGALQRVERDQHILGKVDRHDLNAWLSETLLGRRTPRP